MENKSLTSARTAAVENDRELREWIRGCNAQQLGAVVCHADPKSKEFEAASREQLFRQGVNKTW